MSVFPTDPCVNCASFPNCASESGSQPCGVVLPPIWTREQEFVIRLIDELKRRGMEDLIDI